MIHHRQFNRQAAVRSFSRRLRGIASLIRTELFHGRSSRSISHLIASAVTGFLTDSRRIYDFAEFGGRQAYLSDLDRLSFMRHINGCFRELLDNKWLFHQVMSPHVPMPAILAITWGDGRIAIEGCDQHFNVPDGIASLLQRHHCVVAKPVYGTTGTGVLFIEEHNGGITINRAHATTDALADLLADKVYIVTEWVHQAPYAELVFPNTINTVRLLTMIEPHSGEVFAPIAIHRFGTNVSGSIDAWSKGGLSVEIDLVTGRLGRVAHFSKSAGLVWMDHHPDTEQPISELVIPQWGEARDAVMAAAGKHPFLACVGWDIIFSNGGFAIIEGNNRSDVSLLQVHRPLLADARCRAFFEHHGIVAKK